MTRIRYTNVDGVLKSKPMMVSGRNVQVFINQSQMSFEVVDLDKNFVLAGDTSDTLSRLKILAKQSLKNLGMVFDDEVRRHKNETDVVESEVNNDYTQEHQN